MQTSCLREDPLHLESFVLRSLARHVDAEPVRSRIVNECLADVPEQNDQLGVSEQRGIDDLGDVHVAGELVITLSQSCSVRDGAIDPTKKQDRGRDIVRIEQLSVMPLERQPESVAQEVSLKDLEGSHVQDSARWSEHILRFNHDRQFLVFRFADAHIQPSCLRTCCHCSHVHAPRRESVSEGCYVVQGNLYLCQKNNDPEGPLRSCAVDRDLRCLESGKEADQDHGWSERGHRSFDASHHSRST